MLPGPDHAETCQKQPGGVTFSPEVPPLPRPPLPRPLLPPAPPPRQAWGPEEQRLLRWERNRHYVLVAPPGPTQGGTNLTEGFTCPRLPHFIFILYYQHPLA
jgi:hypothetical protein